MLRTVVKFVTLTPEYPDVASLHQSNKFANYLYQQQVLRNALPFLACCLQRIAFCYEWQVTSVISLQRGR